MKSSLSGYVLIALAVAGAGFLMYQDKKDIRTLNANQSAINNYINAEYDSKLVEDRVVHLPEDGGACYLTIITSEDWKSRQDQREFVAWFDTNPQLMSIKTQTNFQHRNTGERYYQTTLNQQYGNIVPVVCLTKNNGKIIYKASGTNIPGNSQLLADAIVANIADCHPKPEPKPGPGPTPNPNPGPKPNLPDVVTPVDKPSTEDLGLLGIILAGLAGGALGMRNELRKG